MQATIAVYGKDSARVAELRAKQEREAFEATLDSLNASEDMKNELRLAFIVTQDLTAAAAATSGNLSGAAGEAARLAQNLSAAASALSAVMNATANMNVSAIGLEAQNRALAAGNSLIEARTQGLIAAKRVELSDAFGSGDAAIRAAAAAEMDNYTDAVNRNSSAQELNEGLLKQRTDAASAASKASKAGASATKKAEGEAATAAKKAAKEIQKAYEDRIEAAQQLTEKYFTPIEKYADAVAELDDIMGQGHISAETYARAMADINDELADSYPLVNDVADAFGDFVAGGLSDFNGFVDSILGSFKSMLSEMIATAARNQIMISMGIGGGGVGAAASAMGGSGVGAMGGALGGIGASFMGGASGVVSGLMSGGLSGGIGAIGTSLAGATAGLGGLAAAAGAVALPLAAAYAAFKFFSTSTKELDAGLRLNIKGNELLAESYRKVEKSRFFGMSKRKSTSYSASEDSGLADAYGTIYDGISDLTGAFQIGTGVLDKYTKTLSISTKGMSEAEAQAAVLAELTQTQNDLAQVALGRLGGAGVDSRALFQREGETSSDTLARLSASLQTANASLELLGGTLLPLGKNGTLAAIAMADAAGGVEGLASAVGSYYENFYSAEEKLRDLRKEFVDQTNALDVGYVPVLADNFRAKVDQLLADGETEAAAALIAMSPMVTSMAAYREQLDKTTDAAAAAEAAASQALDRGKQQRSSLYDQILELTGQTDRIRERELAALEPLARANQLRVYALQDEKTAQEELARVMETQQNAISRTLEILRTPLALDASRFDNRFAATINAAQNRRDEIRKEADDAQLTEAKLMRTALQRLADEVRDIRLNGVAA
jgi:hypothetical protein